ncbi:hypothetical protein T261_05717 [Streptomyces lydicus]|nr:hypothetical protein T261_05717 [Streptomyces lydicus]
MDIVHNTIVRDVADQIPDGRWETFATQHISIPGELSGASAGGGLPAQRRP